MKKNCSAIFAGDVIRSATDFWDRGPGLESSISHNEPYALQDHCVILEKLQRKRGKPVSETQKRITGLGGISEVVAENLVDGMVEDVCVVHAWCLDML